MQKIAPYIKPFLLSMLLLALFVPMLQNGLHLLEKTYPLKGDVQLAGDVDFEKHKWFTAEYQEQKEKYVNDNFGLRSLFVRLNNQLDFFCFKKANAKDVIIGKENYLYELNYIKAYTGEDFIGKDSINNTIARLKFINDTLQKLNKQLIIMLAPGKATFYPEYIPDEYLTKKSITNYQYFTEEAKKIKLPILDFNNWFIETKKTAKYPLYPQHGVHWSTYGATLSADSLLKTIEAYYHIKTPHLVFNSVAMAQAHETDYDIADGMNLLFKFKSFELAYPNLNEVDTIGKQKPKVLVVSDSFYWGMYGLGIAKCFDSNHHIWYYNKQVFPESFTQEKLVKDLDLKEEINKYSVIIISATDNNLRNVSWGFIENTYQLFRGTNNTPEKRNNDLKKINDVIAKIKNNPQWVADTKKRAKEKNISFDSCLVLEALWQLQLNK